MMLREIVGADSRLFARVEAAPAGPAWPALSFSSRASLDDLLCKFKPQRDLVLMIGADDPLRVFRRQDRGRLLSVVQIAPSPAVATRDLVPAVAIDRERLRHGARWDVSLPLRRAWSFVRRPVLRDAYPEIFDLLIEPHKRGCVATVPALDVTRLLCEPVRWRSFDQDSVARIDYAAYDMDLSRALRRASERARKSGRFFVLRAASRRALKASDGVIELRRILARQRGQCALCGGTIEPGSANPLLQVSIDRIDNGNGAYERDNIQLTHLACNRARNSSSIAEWLTYCAMLDDIPREARRHMSRTLRARQAPAPLLIGS